MPSLHAEPAVRAFGAGIMIATLLAACAGGSTASPSSASGASSAPASASAGDSAAPTAGESAAPAVTPDPNTSGGPLTDYADPNNWMAAPASPDKPVDVFYVYPSTYSRANASAPVVADVSDAGMRTGAQGAYQGQATAFADAANIYAPYYRQLDAYWALTLPAAEHDEAIGGAPTEDITAAFEYYLEHFNNGRPFAIAAHSQGSDVSTHLLADYVTKHPDVYKRLIVAYVIGYSVTPDYLALNPTLRFAAGRDDTGVIVSYNTEAPQVDGTDPVVNPGALAINPISWTTAETTAPASASKGSYLPDSSGTWGKVEHYADATVDTAKYAVIASTPDVEQWSPGGANTWPKGVYHKYDYAFYYYDLQANFNDRIRAFMRGHIAG